MNGFTPERTPPIVTAMLLIMLGYINEFEMLKCGMYMNMNMFLPYYILNGLLKYRC